MQKRGYHDGMSPATIFTELSSSVYIRKDEYFSAVGIEAAGQIATSGNYIKAISGTLGQGFGSDYYVEKSRRELTELTKEQWKNNIEGRLCAATEKLNVTPYGELRAFIKDQLGDLFDEVSEAGTMRA